MTSISIRNWYPCIKSYDLAVYWNWECIKIKSIFR